MVVTGTFGCFTIHASLLSPDQICFGWRARRASRCMQLSSIMIGARMCTMTMLIITPRPPREAWVVGVILESLRLTIQFALHYIAWIVSTLLSSLIAHHSPLTHHSSCIVYLASYIIHHASYIKRSSCITFLRPRFAHGLI